MWELASILAPTEHAAGTSAIAVGLLEQLVPSGRPGGRLPAGRARTTPGMDPLMSVLTSRTGTQVRDNVVGVTYAAMHADPAAAMSRVITRFHTAADGADTMLLIGSDYTDVTAAAEFASNAVVAANLDAAMLLVVPAADRSAADVAAAAEIAVAECRVHHAQVLGVVANRVCAEGANDVLDALRSRLPAISAYAVPNEPLLRAPTMRDLMAACEGTLTAGDPERLELEARGLIVAAMTLPHVLDRLLEAGVVIVPADREEIVLGVLLAHQSGTFPTLAGLVLNGGFAFVRAGPAAAGTGSASTCRSSRPRAARWTRPGCSRLSAARSECRATARSRRRCGWSTSTSTSTACSRSWARRATVS